VFGLLGCYDELGRSFFHGNGMHGIATSHRGAKMRSLLLLDGSGQRPVVGFDGGHVTKVVSRIGRFGS
jgi:hypothetical protein